MLLCNGSGHADELARVCLQDCAHGAKESPVEGTHADKLQGELMVGRSAAAAVQQLDGASGRW